MINVSKLLSLMATLASASAEYSIDLEALQNGNLGDFEGIDLAKLLGGEQPTSHGVDVDVENGYVQTETKLDPVLNVVVENLDDKEEKHYEFQAETTRLMDIIVNSLYSKREVFLRELISNAADALSKMKYNSLANGAKGQDQQELAIYIEPDKKKGTLTIFDTGIGMSKDDLQKNLGTIAQSGSSAFLETTAPDHNVNVIGQFGVGFYSAFLVADDVIVQSKSPNSDDQYLWRSQANDGYTISKVTDNDIGNNGTRITLVLKDDSAKFASPDTVERLIRTHSEFVDFPVYLKKKNKWVHVNPAKPLWHRPKDEISEDEYNKFYRKLSRDHRAPLKTIHYNGEGEVDFKSLLFIPNDKDTSLFNVPGEGGTGSNIKLYSRGILVDDLGTSILPDWMRFVHGVVESNDLPLRVDREQLSNAKEMKVISKRISKKVVDIITKDEDGSLWDHYKTNLFIGCVAEDDESMRAKIAKTFRFKHLLGEDEIRLNQFPKQMEDSEDDPIFYMWANSVEEARHSALLEIFRKQEKDVILVSGTIADQCFAHLQKFGGRALVSVERANVDKYIKPILEEDEEDQLARTRMMAPFVDALRTAILSSQYSTFDKVEVTNKLVGSPSAIFASGTGVTAAQEQHIRNQNWFDEKDMGWRLGKKVLSVNPIHPIVKTLYKQFLEHKDPAENSFLRGARMLYDFALLNGRHHLERPELISYLINDSLTRELHVADPMDFGPLKIDAHFYEEEVESEPVIDHEAEKEAREEINDEL